MKYVQGVILFKFCTGTCNLLWLSSLFKLVSYYSLYETLIRKHANSSDNINFEISLFITYSLPKFVLLLLSSQFLGGCEYFIVFLFLLLR